MHTVFAAGTCTLNGQTVPCEELANTAKNFLGWGIGIGLLMFVLFVAVTIFWLMMLIHAVKHPIEHKPLWILVILLTHLIGAVVYYYAVKKEFDAKMTVPVPTPTPPVPPVSQTPEPPVNPIV